MILDYPVIGNYNTSTRTRQTQKYYIFLPSNRSSLEKLFEKQNISEIN